MHETVTGISVKVRGHLKVVQYDSREDYTAGRPSKTLLNKRNAVHKDDASIMIARALTDRRFGHVAYMAFGNGGTTINSMGVVEFKTPNVTGLNADLYNPIYFQLVDDTLGALAGNQMNVRHMSNSMFSDVDIRCLISANEPFGQLPSNTVGGENNEPYISTDTNFGPFRSQFSFDEIGLKLIDGTLVTHVIFSPVLKTASALLEVVYTLRIFIEQPPGPLLVDLRGVQANTHVGTIVLPKPIELVGVQANTAVGMSSQGFRPEAALPDNA